MQQKKVFEVLFLLKLCHTFVDGGILGGSVPKVIIISMDGFRYDYLDRFIANQTSNFQYFIQNGVKAKYIRNVFPTVTYPNHYTLITGLYPESHGMVHNRFYDPNLLEHFWYDNRMANFDPMWFDNGAEPIYVTNHKAGSNRRAGSVLWPSGLGKVECIGPDYIIPNADPFNKTKFETRIDYLMDWFTDTNNPINLGLLYFDEPDETAHVYGPDSEPVNNLIKGPLNDALGYLKKKLEEADMLESTNIILTADHGFATVVKLINLDDYIPESWYETGGLWQNHIVVQLFPKPGYMERIVQALNHVTDLNIYRKGGEVLKKLHYNNNDRIAPLVIVGNKGVVILNNQTIRNFKLKGMHGYRPDVREMSPFFIAYGPAFKKGYVSDPFDSVDIYPLMCNILGITPAPNNGSLENVKDMLVPKTLFTIPIPFSFTAVSCGRNSGIQLYCAASRVVFCLLICDHQVVGKRMQAMACLVVILWALDCVPTSSVSTICHVLIVVGVSVTVAGIYAICTIIHARRKQRFLLPTSFRGTAEGQSQQSHKLLEDTDDDEL